MGLDAVVYCDCFEKGSLRAPPHPDWRVYVDATQGYRVCAENIELAKKIAFDQWDSTEACEHEDGFLIHHYLGNIGFVSSCWKALAPHAFKLPVLMERVIYSGTHCGDYLDIQMVRTLDLELATLARIHFSDVDYESRIRRLESKLKELAAASLAIGKPICF